jgi:hypothetical protein
MWAAPNAEDAKLLDRDNPASPNYDPEPGAPRITERGLNRPASVLLNRESEPEVEEGAEEAVAPATEADVTPKTRRQRLRERWAGLTARVMSPEPLFGRRNRGENGESRFTRRQKVAMAIGAAAGVAAGVWAGHRLGLYELPFTGNGHSGGNGNTMNHAADMLGADTTTTTTAPNGNSTSRIAEMLGGETAPRTGTTTNANMNHVADMLDGQGSAPRGPGSGAAEQIAQHAPAEATPPAPEVATFTPVDAHWDPGDPTAWSWAQSQGIPEANIDDFLHEVMGSDWAREAQQMQYGDTISAPIDIINKYKMVG